MKKKVFLGHEINIERVDMTQDKLDDRISKGSEKRREKMNNWI